MDRIPTIGIFEGGGARGLAHIGAVKACDRRDLAFESVAGTSAGAIVAALVAAGYKGDEMLSLFDEHDEHKDNPKLKGLFDCDLFDLIDKDEWERLKKFMSSVKSGIELLGSIWTSRIRCLLILLCFSIIVLSTDAYFTSHSPSLESPLDIAVGLALILFVGWVLYHAFRILLPLVGFGEAKCLLQNRGFLSTSKFEKLFNQWLLAKCFPNVAASPTNTDARVVTFRDLRLPLTVVAHDVAARQLVKFSTGATPDMSVAKAVAASMAVPFVFQPVEVNGKCLIDGGAASAFPAWAVDDFLKEDNPFKLVLGFRLGATQPYEVATFASYAVATFFSLVFGDDSLERRRVPGLIDIRLGTSIRPWQFHLTNRQKRDILRDGSNAAYAALATKLRPPVKVQIEQLLNLTIQRMRQLSDLTGVHLRANLALPIGSNRIQICCTSNFEFTDCDDRLEFDTGVGATGHCWKTGQMVGVNLGNPVERQAGAWKMTKYQQIHIRKSLRSLLSIPIAKYDDWIIIEDRYRVRPEVTPMGVLNFDSDADVNSTFRSPGGMQVALDCAQLLASVLDKNI